MSNVSLINYSTREFTTKGEMDSYIRKQDEIFTKEVTKIFIETGMLRRVVTQIWNKKETFRVGIIFEYKDQTAYKNCQSLLEKHYLPYLKDYNTKVIGSRGIVVHEFVSDDFT